MTSFQNKFKNALEIVSQVKSATVADRKRAWNWIIEEKNRSIPHLRLYLKEGLDDEREYAAELLGEIGTRDDVPFLIEALGDKIEFVRFDAQAAIESILRLGPNGLEEIVPEILEITEAAKCQTIRQAVRSWWSNEGSAAD